MTRNHSRDDWRDFDRETRRGGVRIVGWLAVALVLALVVGVIFWGFRVATSPVKGEGDAAVTKNSASNRIAAQEAYVSALNEVKRADRNLDTLAAAQTDSAAAKTRYVGAVSYCQSVAADYDALADKFRSADFIPTGYPVAIDELDPATDCQETNR